MALVKQYINIVFCALFILGVQGSVRLAQAADKNPDLAIWNPKAVNWWVAASGETDDLCQIHWVYDDEIDVYLKKNAENLYYFGIEYIGGDKELMQLFGQGKFEAILIIDEKQVRLNWERMAPNKMLAKASWAINSLEYLRKGEALFLKSEDVLYSFPLENSSENYDVYYQCLRDNGQYIERSAPVEAQPLPQTSPASPAPLVASNPATSTTEPRVDAPDNEEGYVGDGFSLLFGNNSEQQAELAREAEERQVITLPPAEPQPIADIVPQELNETGAPNEIGNVEPNTPEAPEVPRLPQGQDVPETDEMNMASVDNNNTLRKSQDFLGSDLNYIEDDGANTLQSQNGSATDGENACGEEVGGNVTGVIQNLTRKLTILEREKETLRMKLIASGNDPVVSDLLACKTSGVEEQALLDASNSAIEEYKILIESMRAEIDTLKSENELLNASVVDAPAANADSIPEIARLNDRIKELEIRNLQLNREIEEFKNIIDDEAETQDQGDAQDTEGLSEEQEQQMNEILEETPDWDDFDQEMEEFLP